MQEQKHRKLVLSFVLLLLAVGCSNRQSTTTKQDSYTDKKLQPESPKVVMIPEGYGAATVEVSKELMPKESIRGGIMVDVFVEFKVEDMGDISGADSIRTMIFRNEMVLGVKSSSKEVVSVTLMLKRAQIEGLDDAKQKNGKFWVKLSQ